jgi:hypothetical protein
MHLMAMGYQDLLFCVCGNRQENESISAYAFAIFSLSNIKPLCGGFAVAINGQNWTVSIMMFGETTLALLAGNEPEDEDRCPRSWLC